MKRSLISSAALAGAMLLSTSAFAQTTVMGNSVSAEDLPKVQAACDTLAAKSQADAAASNTETKTDAAAEAPAAGDAAANTETSADASAGETDAGVNAATTTSIDLALLTYEECQKAGLVK